MQKMQFRVVILTLALCFVQVIAAYGQTGGGTILGTVSDASGARVPNAQVSMKNAATGESRTVATNENGFYNAPSLSPGNYDIAVTAAGFQTLVRKGVAVLVGRELTLNLELRVGAVTQQVEVAGEISQVELSTSTVSGSIEATTIRELPLNGRDWVQLTTLQAGVAPLRGANPVGVPAISPRLESGEGQQIALSGGRPEMLVFLMNGVSMMDYANTSPGAATGNNLGVDAIQEFSVIVSTPPAGYGRTASGVVTAAVRSGSNRFHGSGIAFFRNSALDAKNYFDFIRDPNTLKIAPIPPFYRHQYGGSIGGPIKKDSTFFFFDYEGFRQSLTQTVQGSTISDAARAGNFANGDVVAPSALIQKYLTVYPEPTTCPPPPTDSCSFTSTGALVLSEDYYIGRIDHRFGSNDSFNSAYFFDKGSQGAPDSLKSYVIGDITHRQAITLEETHIFNSHLANSWRGGYTRTYASDTHVLSIMRPALADPTLGSIPGLDMSTMGIGDVGGFGPGQNAQDVTSFQFNSFQLYDDLSYVHGIHTLKFGGSFEFDLDNYDSPNQHAGVWNFNTLEDFYKGNPASFGAQIPGLTTERGARQKVYGIYLQDDIRLRPHLTLNLGLRYERATAPTEVHGKLADLRNITDPASTIGSLYVPSKMGFSPRIGLVWDPFGNGKTAVRAGFGIYDALPLLYEMANRFNRGYPFYQQGLVNWGAPNPPPPANVFPSGGLAALQAAPSIVTVSVEHNPHRSYLTQWNMNVQRDLGRGFAAQVGYIGSRGTHLSNGDYDINTYVPQIINGQPFWDPNIYATCQPPNPPAACMVQQSGGPCPVLASGPQRDPTRELCFVNDNFTQIYISRWNGVSFYHALQASLTKKMSNGLQLQANYTFSKSIDTNSIAFSSGGTLSGIANPYPPFPKINRGPSDFNVPHNFIVNWLYNVPKPHWDSGIANATLKGWEVGGIFTASSGEPWSALLLFDNPGAPFYGTGTGSHAFIGWVLGERPDLVNTPGCANPNEVVKGNITVGGLPIQNTAQYVKPGCLIAPGDPANAPGRAGHIGNFGRNRMYNPGLVNVDFSLYKNNYVKSISDNFNVQLRFEFFNVFNHTNLGYPTLFNMWMLTGNFGQAGYTATPARQIQMGVKINF